MIRRVATVALALAIVAAPLTASAMSYKSTEFGVETPAPTGLAACGSRHGVTIFLDRRPKLDCDEESDEDRHPSMGVFAAFAATDDTTTLDAVFRSECTYAESRPSVCRPGPPGLVIPGHATRAARIVRRDRMIEYQVIARTGPPDPVSGAVYYVFSVMTTPERRARDLAQFRRYLRGARLWKPDAPDGGDWQLR